MAYSCKTVGELNSGLNNGVLLPCKVIMHLEKPNDVPMSFLVVDSKQCYSVVSFYHTDQTLAKTLQANDLLYIKNPQLIFTSLDFKNRSYSYNCVKVDNMMNVLLNGQPITSTFTQAEVSVNTFA